MSAALPPVVIVTGASRGIGLAVTSILLDTFGAHVVAISRTKSPELVELLKTHSETLQAIECNVTDDEALTRAIGLAEKTYHHIDGLVLNAGVVEPLGKVETQATSLGQWKEHFDVNFFSLVTAIKAALPALRKSELGGRIVFVSSGAATGGSPGWAPYNASKAAMNSLCRTLGQEEPDVVSVALRPGMVDTDMQAQLRASPDRMAEKSHQVFVKAHAEGTLVKPEDAGHVIAALSLKAPKSISGTFVMWNGDECKDYRR